MALLWLWCFIASTTLRISPQCSSGLKKTLLLISRLSLQSPKSLNLHLRLSTPSKLGNEEHRQEPIIPSSLAAIEEFATVEPGDGGGTTWRGGWGGGSARWSLAKAHWSPALADFTAAPCLPCVCVCLFIYFVFGLFVGFAKLEVKVRPTKRRSIAL